MVLQFEAPLRLLSRRCGRRARRLLRSRRSSASQDCGGSSLALASRAGVAGLAASLSRPERRHLARPLSSFVGCGRSAACRGPPVPAGNAARFVAGAPAGRRRLARWVPRVGVSPDPPPCGALRARFARKLVCQVARLSRRACRALPVLNTNSLRLMGLSFAVVPGAAEFFRRPPSLPLSPGRVSYLLSGSRLAGCACSRARRRSFAVGGAAGLPLVAIFGGGAPLPLSPGYLLSRSRCGHQVTPDFPSPFVRSPGLSGSCAGIFTRNYLILLIQSIRYIRGKG